MYTKLLDEWNDLLRRRPAFREPLAAYAAVLQSWSRWPEGRVHPLAWTVDECRERWRQGIPLLSQAAPFISPDNLEELLGAGIDFLLAAGTDHTALQGFADSWDRGEIGWRDLLPANRGGGAGRAPRLTGLSPESLAFLACVSLRPALESYLSSTRQHLSDHDWDGGLCPFCGSPPGFADLIEDGRLRLACHTCGGAWLFPRTRCPSCNHQSPADLVHFQPEDQDEGYSVVACRKCQEYVKELDRRLRWNAGSALIEDWGTPHLDLVAHRAGYRRALPSLIQLTQTA